MNIMLRSYNYPNILYKLSIVTQYATLNCDVRSTQGYVLARG